MEGGFARLETLGGGGSELCVDGWQCALGYDQIDSADDGDRDDEGVREEEACRPPSPLTFPATTATAAYDRRRQGTNIVRALDGDRLRNRWSSLVEGMHRRELERAEGDVHHLDAELSDGGSSVSSASTSSVGVDCWLIYRPRATLSDSHIILGNERCGRDDNPPPATEKTSVGG